MLLPERIAVKLPRIFQKLMLSVLLGACLFSQTLALATDLPPYVLSYIRKKDPLVQVRFDGMVTFSNGESYLPILPQDPSDQKRPATSITSMTPEGEPYPDLIEFDNNLFLIRLVPTSTGRLTLPRLPAYPIAMKEGVLPQDLLLPANLFIPSELKVLLGALPYNPQATPDPDDVKSTLGNPMATLLKRIPKTVYLSNLSTQSLIALDPDSGGIHAKIPLNCVPSSLIHSQDEKQVFATCLTTDELIVVDTLANLVKTRIPVGSKPTDSVLVEETGDLFISNRFSEHLNVVKVSDLMEGVTIPLPSSGGVMVYSPETNRLYVAGTAIRSSSGKMVGRVYELDLGTRNVLRTLQTQPNISALWLPEDGSELWVASRSSNKLSVIDLQTGKTEETLEVGDKPVSLEAVDEKLFVLSANADQVDVVDWEERKVLRPIFLEEGSFPSGMALSGDGKLAYISAAGSNSVYLVDVQAGILFRALPLSIRGNAITVIGGEKREPKPRPQRLSPLEEMSGSVQELLPKSFQKRSGSDAQASEKKRRIPFLGGGGKKGVQQPEADPEQEMQTLPPLEE